VLDGEVGLIQGRLRVTFTSCSHGWPRCQPRKDQEIGGRGDDVGRALHEVAPAVAIEIDGLL